MKRWTWNFLVLMGCFVIAMAIAKTAFGQGVLANEIAAAGDRVDYIGDDIGHLDDVGANLARVPPDDSGKWHLSIYTTPGCSACMRLKNDLQTDPQLRALVAWSHVQYYTTRSRSQLFRFRATVTGTYPTIIISPPKNSTLFPAIQVFRRTGYDGNAGGLARDAVAAIRAFIKRILGRDIRPTPGPTPQYVPTPPSVLPRPIDPMPTIPDFPPIVPTPATTTSGREIVLIVDPDGIGEKLKARAAETIAQRIAEKRDIKFRMVRWDENTSREFPLVSRSDTPAVIGLRDGQTTLFLSGSALDAFRDPQTREIMTDGGESDHEGLSMFEGSLVGGAASGWGLLAIVAAVAGFRFIKRRRAGEAIDPQRLRPSVQLKSLAEAVKAARATAEATRRDAGRAAADAKTAADNEAAEVAAAAEALNEE